MTTLMNIYARKLCQTAASFIPFHRNNKKTHFIFESVTLIERQKSKRPIAYPICIGRGSKWQFGFGSVISCSCLRGVQQQHCDVYMNKRSKTALPVPINVRWQINENFLCPEILPKCSGLYFFHWKKSLLWCTLLADQNGLWDLDISRESFAFSIRRDT